MAKINPNLLPATPVRVEKVSVPIAGQGEFLIYLRQPDFSEVLKIEGEVVEQDETWAKRGDWYPSTPPTCPSFGLWRAVISALHLQCREDGSDLPPEERYVEQELVPILGRVPAAFAEVSVALAALTLAVGDSQGNASEVDAAPSSAPALNTDNNTPT